MLAIINNITNLGIFFATVGIPTAVTKFVAQSRGLASVGDDQSSPAESPVRGRYSLAGIAGTSLLTLAVPLVVLSAALFFGADTFARSVYHEPSLAPLLRIATFSLLLASLGTTYGQALLQGMKEVKRISLINTIVSLVSLPVTIVLTVAFHLRGSVVAQLGCGVLASALTATYVVRSGLDFTGLRFDRLFWPRMMSLALPAFLSGLVMVPALWVTTTRLSVAKGFGDVGLFNICYGLFQMILFIPVAVGMPLVPMIAEAYPGRIERVRRLTRISLELVTFVALLVSAAVGVFARPAISLLYGHSYIAAARPMILMTGAVFIATIGMIVGHYFAGTGKMWTGMAFNLLWFVSLLGFAFGLMGRWGVLGLTFAFWASYCLATIAMLVYVRRVIGLPVGNAALLCTLSALVTLLSYTLFARLHGVAYVACGLAALGLIGLVGYWLLPTKDELRNSLGVIWTGLRTRLLHRPASAGGL